MISLRRFAVAILVASLVNTLLFTIVFRDTDALLEGAGLTAGYWMLPSFGLIVAVEFFSLAWTATGLLLALGIGILAIPHTLPLSAAKLVFVMIGTSLGWALFGLLLDSQLPMIVFGAVSSLVFVLLCPRWFAAWDESALAES